MLMTCDLTLCIYKITFAFFKFIKVTYAIVRYTFKQIDIFLIFYLIMEVYTTDLLCPQATVNFTQVLSSSVSPCI